MSDKKRKRKEKKEKTKKKHKKSSKSETNGFNPDKNEHSKTLSVEDAFLAKLKEIKRLTVGQRVDETKLFGRETGLGRKKTVSVALPGSILANAQSRELRSYLAGQIARSLAVFKVDEVVIFNDNSLKNDDAVEFNDCDELLFNILQYMETPQYLRKNLFPRHRDLQYAGLLNPVDAPHHLRMHEKSQYREGVVLESGKAYVGFEDHIKLDKKLEPGTRVTIKLVTKKNKLVGECVSPSRPREDLGVYWGYQIRLAKSLVEVFTESTFDKGYDLLVGTSENGTTDLESEGFKFPDFEHILIVFGGVQGLEKAVEDTPELDISRSKTKHLFDMYINSCPEQGSRTIRTEEAIPITLSLLRPHLNSVFNKTSERLE